MLTGAVLSKLAHPYRFGLGFSSTLAGAKARKLDARKICASNFSKESKGDCNKLTAVCACARARLRVCVSKRTRTLKSGKDLTIKHTQKQGSVIASHPHLSGRQPKVSSDHPQRIQARPSQRTLLFSMSLRVREFTTVV